MGITKCYKTASELAAALTALETVYGVRGLLRERAALALRSVALSRNPAFGSRQERCRLLCEVGNALLLVGDFAPALTHLAEAEALADQLRDITRQVHALGLQAQCFFGLDRWDEMLPIEEKRQELEKRYGHERVGVMCFCCGLGANVLAVRGVLPPRAIFATSPTTIWPPSGADRRRVGSGRGPAITDWARP